MKFRLKQTKCFISVVFCDATFAQSDPNRGFLRVFFAQNGTFVQGFVSAFYFLGSLTRNFGAGTRNSKPRNSFFGAWNFFSGLVWKNPVAETFSRRLGGRFFLSLEFFPEHVSRVILSKESPPGLSRLPKSCAGNALPLFRKIGNRRFLRHFDFRTPRVAAFFPRRPGPVAEYANLGGRKMAFCQCAPGSDILSSSGGAGETCFPYGKLLGIFHIQGMCRTSGAPK